MPLAGEPAWPPSVLYCNDNGFLQSKLYSEETLPHSGFFFFSPPPHPSEASKGKPCQAREVVVCVVRGCSGARPNWSAQLFIFISFHYTKPRAGERVEETQAQCLLHQL